MKATLAHKFNAWDQRGDGDGQITPLFTRRASGLLTFARSATAYQQRVAATPLVALTANKPRECEMVDAAGVTRRGLLVEAQATNKQTYSADLSNAVYAKTRCSVPTTGVVCPDGITRTTSTIHEDTTAGDNHFIASDAGTVAAGNIVFSFYAKPASREWLAIGVYDAIAPLNFGYAYFHLTGQGVVGTVDAGFTDVGISYVGNGWYRCMGVVHLAAIGYITSYVFAATADAGWVFAGLDQDSLYVWGWQVEFAQLTSQIPTAASAVTRAADSLKFPSQYLVGNSVGTARGAFLAPTFTPGREHTIFCLSNNEAAEDHMRVYVDTDGALKFASAMTAGSAGAITLSGNVCDNVVREWLLAWSPDKVVFACRPINGATVWGMDTDVDIPAVHEADGFCHVGSYAAGTELGPIIICSLKLSDKFQPSFADKLGGFTEAF